MLYRIEELLLEVYKFEAEESTRKSIVVSRANSTPLRRVESASISSKAKNWILIVFHAREAVAKGLNFQNEEKKVSTVSMTQHLTTRRFVGKVLEHLSYPRPGSFFDFRLPSWIMKWFVSNPTANASQLQVSVKLKACSKQLTCCLSGALPSLG